MVPARALLILGNDHEPRDAVLANAGWAEVPARMNGLSSSVSADAANWLVLGRLAEGHWQAAFFLVVFVWRGDRHLARVMASVVRRL